MFDLLQEINQLLQPYSLRPEVQGLSSTVINIENSRVLEWIFKRCDGAVDAVETPIGLLPTLDGLNLDQLGLSEDAIASLLRVDADGWMAELPLIEDYYASFGEHVPQELKEELEELKRKLEAVTVNVA